jgi:hypothetical protein
MKKKFFDDKKKFEKEFSEMEEKSLELGMGILLIYRE